MPGLRGGTSGHFIHDRNGNRARDEGEGLPSTKLGLVHWESGLLVATATTDASGKVEFTDVPVGVYRVHVYGPWVVDVRWQSEIEIATGEYTRTGWVGAVLPGTQLPDPRPAVDPAPATTATTTPAPQAAPVHKLANTGADVTGLGLAGLLAVAAGIVLVVLSRRRRPRRSSSSS